MKNSLFQRITRVLMAILLAVGPAGLGLNAHAYVWNACDDGSDWIRWEEDEGAICDGCVSLGLNTISFPAGGTWDSEIQTVMAQWNDVERSKATFYYWRDSDGSYSHGNGENEVVFDGIDGAGDTLAVTTLIYNEGWGTCVVLEDSNISEADVIFDEDESWYSGTFSYTSASYSFRTVAMHELGHVLGLLHEDSRLARMNSYYPHGGPITQSRLARPLADDRAGIRYIYSESGTAKADLVGSNYKRTGSGTSGLVSSPTSAARNSSVTMEYTFMNIGSADSGSFKIGFYLSSNDTITTGDRLLGSNSGASASAGGTVSSSRTLTIPSSVTPGTYYLGVLLDKDGTVTEWNDSDNGLAQPRTIVIY